MRGPIAAAGLAVVTILTGCAFVAQAQSKGAANQTASGFEAAARQGQAQLDAGHPELALPYLETAIRLRPEDSPSLFNLGVAQLETGRTELAFQTLSRLASREPGEIATRSYLVRAAVRSKKPEVARANLAALRKLAPADALLHAQLVEWLFQDEAAAMTREQIGFTLGLSLPPANQARVHYLAGLLEQRQKQVSRATDEFTRALKLDDAHEEYFAALVNLQGSSHVEKIDLGILSRGLARFPESKDLQIADALRRMNAGSTNEALAIANQLVSKHPRAPEVHVLLGRLQLSGLEFDKAATSLGRAIELGSKDSAARYYLGIAYRRKEQDSQAIEQFEKALALQPDYPDALLELGRTYFDLGQYEKASHAFSAVIREMPSNATAYNLMAQSLQRLGKPSEAASYLARFKELSAR